MHEESSRSHFIDVWTRAPYSAHWAPGGGQRRGRSRMLHRIPPGGGSRGVSGRHAGGNRPRRGRLAQGTRECPRRAPRASRRARCRWPTRAWMRRSAQTCSSTSRTISAPWPSSAACCVPAPGGARRPCRCEGVRLLRSLPRPRAPLRAELTGKARRAGLEVLENMYLGTLLYPAFWLVKQRNRRRYDHLRGVALKGAWPPTSPARATPAWAGSPVASRRLCSGHGVRLPFGIRELLVVRRPRLSR